MRLRQDVLAEILRSSDDVQGTVIWSQEKDMIM